MQPTPVEETPATEYSYAELRFTPEEALMVAQTIYGEAGVCSYEERRLVAWCICNRVDSGTWGSTISEVVNPGQFHGYNANNPVNDEIYELCKDVIARWIAEKEGNENVGRVLPTGYNWFYGDGVYNYFRNEYKTSRNWDWSLPSPYNT